MEKQNISVQYSAKITDIVSVNSSFDRGELWIAYEGKNRNGSFISKRAFEKSTPTLAYCPVVVNYDIEEEHFGGHDVDLVSTDDGVQMLNMTDPVGVVPKETQPWFQIAEEENGEPVNDAIYKRNLQVEEKFNIKIKALYPAWESGWAGELEKLARGYIQSGDDGIDAV